MHWGIPDAKVFGVFLRQSLCIWTWNLAAISGLGPNRIHLKVAQANLYQYPLYCPRHPDCIWLKQIDKIRCGFAIGCGFVLALQTASRHTHVFGSVKRMLRLSCSTTLLFYYNGDPFKMPSSQTVLAKTLADSWNICSYEGSILYSFLSLMVECSMFFITCFIAQKLCNSYFIV